MKRKTTQKEAMRDVFRQLDRPLGIEEILKAGRERVPALNLATVYRNVKLFLEEGWLVRFNHPTLGTLYERTGKDHHHHFYCRICERVFELPGCALNEKQATPEGFVTESHEIFLSGVCMSCSSHVLEGQCEV